MKKVLRPIRARVHLTGDQEMRKEAKSNRRIVRNVGPLRHAIFEESRFNVCVLGFEQIKGKRENIYRSQRSLEASSIRIRNGNYTLDAYAEFVC